MIQEGPQYFLRHRYCHLAVLSLPFMNVISSAPVCPPTICNASSPPEAQAYCSAVHGTAESQQVWEQLSRTENPQFKYWPTITELELLMCRFIRSLREGQFPLYVQVCDELCAWFRVMDHTNYARWLSVHVRDMYQLSETHTDIHAKFLKGNFVVQKSPHKCSLIGKDQSHEQSNKSLQSHGGAVVLYEIPETLTLFMLAGPYCSRCVE